MRAIPETETARECGPFERAAEGTRTLDLLHGNRLGGRASLPVSPANRKVQRRSVRYRSPQIAAISAGFPEPIRNERTPWGRVDVALSRLVSRQLLYPPV